MTQIKCYSYVLSVIATVIVTGDINKNQIDQRGFIARFLEKWVEFSWGRHSR